MQILKSMVQGKDTVHDKKKTGCGVMALMVNLRSVYFWTYTTVTSIPHSYKITHIERLLCQDVNLSPIFLMTYRCFVNFVIVTIL